MKKWSSIKIESLSSFMRLNDNDWRDFILEVHDNFNIGGEDNEGTGTIEITPTEFLDVLAFIISLGLEGGQESD